MKHSDLARTGRALRAERGRERPAERTGRAQIGLPGAVEVDHRAGPDPGIAGIGDQHAVARQGPRDLGAQPFDGDRRRVLFDQRRHAGAPVGDDPRGFLGVGTVADRTSDDLVEPGQRRLRVADDAGRVRIGAADLERVGLDLDDPGVDRRYRSSSA